MPTERTVLFLGAGASKALGYPVTSEILARILERLDSNVPLFSYLNVIYALTGEHALVNEAGFLPDASKVLKDELTALMPGVLSNPGSAQITELLSLIDHLIVTGNCALPGFPRERLARLRLLVERAVATVVTRPDTVTAEHQALIDTLVKWAAAESAKPEPQRHLITVITTNYDMAVEKPLVDAIAARHPARSNRIDYGFNWRDPVKTDDSDQNVVWLRPEQPALGFYKLHGSINWLRCPLCDHVYLNQYGPIFDLAFASLRADTNTCCCSQSPMGTLLVAPSMIRDIRDPSLLAIWQAALEAMRLAQRWVFVGYSLPSEDLAIRSLFLRASRGRPAPPAVELYENGDRPEVDARYKVLLPNVRYDGGGFKKFINGLPA
jgi:hypothetical protein